MRTLATRTTSSPSVIPAPGVALPFLALAIFFACAGSTGCARSQRPALATSPAPLDESALMAELRAQVKPAPESALALADDGDRRFGDSAASEERRALAIEALINLQRIGSARSRAYGFLERYPDGPYSAHVAAMTGVHVTPRGPGPGR